MSIRPWRDIQRKKTRKNKPKNKRKLPGKSSEICLGCFLSFGILKNQQEKAVFPRGGW